MNSYVGLIHLNHVAHSVSVYAYKKGRKGVDRDDLWYAIIECIRVDKRAKASEVCIHCQLAYHNFTIISLFIAFLGQDSLVLEGRL
jgi:hypothetical protein